jgi:multiple sugar transport system permease protein
LRFIESFRVFDTIFVLTGGGPGNMTTSISIYIYEMGFSMGKQSVASAAGLILFMIMLIPTILSVRGIGRSDNY